MIALPRGPWCCEEGERLGMTVCPECAETSAAYQSCLGPDREYDRREAMTDEYIDKLLSTAIPGGSQARDWFLPHNTKRGLENVRDVVRRIVAAAYPPPLIAVDMSEIKLNLPSN